MPKIHHAKKLPVPKSPYVEKSLDTKYPEVGTFADPTGNCAEKYLWWNLGAEMTFAKMSDAEISPSHSKVGVIQGGTF